MSHFNGVFSVASCKRLSGLECNCPYQGLRPFTHPHSRTPSPAAHLGLQRGVLRAGEGVLFRVGVARRCEQLGCDLKHITATAALAGSSSVSGG